MTTYVPNVSQSGVQTASYSKADITCLRIAKRNSTDSSHPTFLHTYLVFLPKSCAVEMGFNADISIQACRPWGCQGCHTVGQIGQKCKETSNLM